MKVITDLFTSGIIFLSLEQIKELFIHSSKLQSLLFFLMLITVIVARSSKLQIIIVHRFKLGNFSSLDEINGFSGRLNLLLMKKTLLTSAKIFITVLTDIVEPKNNNISSFLSHPKNYRKSKQEIVNFNRLTESVRHAELNTKYLPTLFQ